MSLNFWPMVILILIINIGLSRGEGPLHAPPNATDFEIGII